MNKTKVPLQEKGSTTGGFYTSMLVYSRVIYVYNKYIYNTYSQIIQLFSGHSRNLYKLEVPARCKAYGRATFREYHHNLYGPKYGTVPPF